jgi:hypothetical protein
MTTTKNTTKKLIRQAFTLSIIALIMASCKEQRLNDCGEPVDEVCGGIGCQPPDADLIFIVTSPSITNETPLISAKQVRVYNSDDSDMGGWLTTKYLSGFECNNSQWGGGLYSSDLVVFSVPPGKTLNWVARTNDNTKSWSGSFYNKDCQDEENCRVVELNVD